MKINVRLRPGKDDNLGNWYKSLPEGDKSRIVRNILKRYVSKDQRLDVLDYITKKS
ncbi:MAG: hypothetical protein ACOCRK_08705 [bacterium]